MEEFENLSPVQLTRELQSTQETLSREDDLQLTRELQSSRETLPREEEFQALAFCGGGARCIATIGMLGKLESEKRLENIKAVSGCSAGAFIAVMYLMGVKPINMLDVITDQKIKIDLPHLMMTLDRKGLFRIERFTKKFRRLVQDFLKMKKPTLADFYTKTGRDLFIQVTDKDRHLQLFLNHKTHPDVPLLDAVHASASIPIVFTPVLIDGYRCVDGGVVTSMPTSPLETYYICVLDCAFESESVEETFVDYLYKVLKTASTIKKREDLARIRGKHIIARSRLGLLDFNNPERNLQDFMHGWEQGSHLDA